MAIPEKQKAYKDEREGKKEREKGMEAAAAERRRRRKRGGLCYVEAQRVT